MKILKKRCMAFLVDISLFGSAVVLIDMYILSLLPHENNSFILLFFLFPARDIVFGNASLGKMIFGLRVYDKFWRKPTFKTLYRRSLVSSMHGYHLYSRALTVTGSFLPIFDADREKGGGYVIEKKMYEEFHKKALETAGNYSDKMSAMFAAYLVENYRKDD